MGFVGMCEGGGGRRLKGGRAVGGTAGTLAGTHGCVHLLCCRQRGADRRRGWLPGRVDWMDWGPVAACCEPGLRSRVPLTLCQHPAATSRLLHRRSCCHPLFNRHCSLSLWPACSELTAGAGQRRWRVALGWSPPARLVARLSRHSLCSWIQNSRSLPSTSCGRGGRRVTRFYSLANLANSCRGDQTHRLGVREGKPAIQA